MKSHTSVRLPPNLRRAAEQAQTARGFGSFSAYLCDVIRRDLSTQEMKGVESRLAVHISRIDRKVDSLKREQGALFSVAIAMTRELLLLDVPAERAEVILKRILVGVRDDLAGVDTEPADDVFDGVPIPDQEEVPFGDYEG